MWLSKADFPRKRQIEETEEAEFNANVSLFNPLVESPVRSDPPCSKRKVSAASLRKSIKVPRRSISSNGSCEENFGTPAKYRPQKEEELVVNPKKVAELKEWLSGRLTSPHAPRCLLLTGPSGSAKSTALKVLCASLNIGVVEIDGCEYELTTLGDIWERASSKVFQDLIRGAEMAPINTTALKHRLILIEHLPNLFYREPRLLRQTLAEFVISSPAIVAFVLSNVESCWELNPMRLFTPELLQSMHIHHIKFSAVSTRLMNTALAKVAQKMGAAHNSELLASISASSEGDIRKAINTLEFYRRPESKSGVKPILGKSSTRAISASAGTSAPLHFDLFHFIGKVMYANRATGSAAEWNDCERKLRKDLRLRWSKAFPPKDDTNMLISSAALSAPFLLVECLNRVAVKLSDYIFEHEPNFAPSFSNLSAELRNLCHADVNSKTGNMEEKERMNKYHLEVSWRLLYRMTEIMPLLTHIPASGGAYRLRSDQPCSTMRDGKRAGEDFTLLENLNAEECKHEHRCPAIEIPSNPQGGSSAAHATGAPTADTRDVEPCWIALAMAEH